ncbi:MAG: T9SS type A sorting domain-containing protein [Bacteroidota bacterium]
MKKFTFLLSIIALLVSAQIYAQNDVLFSEDFEDELAGSRWDISEVGTSNLSNFALEYTSNNLEAAPNGGDYCLKLEVNKVNEEISFIGLLPKDTSFTGSYTLTFNAWLNWEGSAGTTEFIYFGVGHGSADGFPADGYDLAFTGDNGASQDIRMYKDSEELDIDDCDNCSYAGDTQNGGVEPYTTSLATPPEPGNQWLKVSAEVSESSITYKVNDVEWARVEELPADGNIVIGYMDLFTSVAPATNFLLIDNVVVTEGVAVGINDYETDIASIYPNPAKNMINVVVNDRSTFQLVNFSGQTIMNRMVEGRTTIDVSGMKSGMYLARITNQSGRTQTLKVIIQ